MTFKKWLEAVEDRIGDEDVSVAFGNALKKLWRDGETVRAAADYVLALDQGD